MILVVNLFVKLRSFKSGSGAGYKMAVIVSCSKAIVKTECIQTESFLHTSVSHKQGEIEQINSITQTCMFI